MAPGAGLHRRTSSLMMIMRAMPTAWPRTTFYWSWNEPDTPKCWRWSPTARINKAFGRANVPLGAYQGGISSAGSNSAWSQQIAARFGTPGDVRSNYPDAVTTLRTALAAAANGSVTYVSTGFLTNLAALLQSFPDAFSPLTGAQLVTAKVVEIVIMGGDYPTGSDEFNFAGDPASAPFVFANSPVAITGTGASLGASITVRPPSASNGATDPFSYALSLEGAASTGGYDPLAVHYAVMGYRTITP
jgi:pyrimidine-specific ribonucleoside hydrolase